MEKRVGLGNYRWVVEFTVFTLVIVPVVYAIFDKLIARFSKNKNTKTMQEMMVEDYTPLQIHENGHGVPSSVHI